MSSSTMPSSTGLSRLEFALQRINAARFYTLPLIETVKLEDWFKMSDGVTHLAWQVGHIAAAQYGLAIRCVRGKPEAGEVLPSSYPTLFGRGTKVQADPTAYPDPSEILRIFHHVHDCVPREIGGFTDQQLSEPAIHQAPMWQTKFDALIFAAEHEFIHAGQIGVLRRALGYEPLR
jgi:hypothetical protein